MGDIGGAFVLLVRIAAFGVMALSAGLGLALWSICLPIEVWHAAVIMGIFGVCGAVFVVRD